MITENYDLTFQANIGSINVGDNPNWPNDNLSPIPYELFLENFTPVVSEKHVIKQPIRRFALVTPQGYVMLRCSFVELFDYHNDPSFTIIPIEFVGA